MQYAEPGRLLRKGNTPPSVESSHPVASAHVLDAHRRAGPRRVDEAIVAEENSDVGIGPPLGVVEDQVARFELRQGHVPADSALCQGVMRQLDPEGFPIDVRHQAAAVEAVLGRLYTP